MPRKLTYEFVKSEFEKESYKLLTDVYTGCDQKLDYICPNGHEYSITYHSFGRGRRCYRCFANIRLTHEFVKSEFEKENYKLLSKEYKNSRQKLDCVCPNGHTYSITWSDWKKGVRCVYCYYSFSAGQSSRLTYDFVKNEFKKRDYKLLSREYKNSNQKLECVCPSGHRWSTSYHTFRVSDCPYCTGSRTNIDEIRKSFKKEGYTLLSNSYIDAHASLHYMCDKGHRHKMSWTSWKSHGKRCPYCGGGLLDINNVKRSFEKERYKILVDEFPFGNIRNSKKKFPYICNEGHRHFTTWSHWNSGFRCPTCALKRKSLTMMGENNPSWKGGVSCEPYCQIWSDKEYKESIKQRDGYRCMNPDCWNTHKALSIHHIDYNKKSCGPENLITLCRSCNGRANKDREWHKAWYQAIMYRRYGYVT